MRHYARIFGLTLSVLLLAAFPTDAAPVDFFATLSGAAESPPTPSTGTGFTHVTLDVAAQTLRVEVTFSGLSSGVTAAHIHCCIAPPTVLNAGVATTVPTFPGFPSGVTAGSYAQTFDMTMASSYNPAFVTSNGGTVATAEAVLFAGMLAGGSYLNIHTSTFPGGEIRAILTVPEAGTLLLLGAGLVGLAQRLRRMRATP